jgi:hypothetical protein
MLEGRNTFTRPRPAPGACDMRGAGKQRFRARTSVPRKGQRPTRTNPRRRTNPTRKYRAEVRSEASGLAAPADLAGEAATWAGGEVVPFVQCRGCGALVKGAMKGRCGRCYRQLRRRQGYDTTAWGRCAKAFLTAHPVCKCGKPARVAHHKYPGMRPSSPGGMDWRNLAAKCHACHNRIARSYRL